jgi:AP-3 complex subunit beta
LTVLKERSGNKSGDSVVSAAMDVLRMLIKARVEQPPVNGASESQATESASTAHILYRLSTLLFKANDKLEALSGDGGSTSTPSLIGKTSIADGSGRASIYWLLGQFCRQELKVRRDTSLSGEEQLKTLAEVILPDVLRKGCLNFSKESTQAKLALLTLSAKLYVFLPTTDAPPSVVASVAQLHSYLLQLGRYDLTYDVRDRARYYKNLTAGVDTSMIQANGANETTESAEADEDDSQEVVPTGGVRLRREQVLLVLFGDRASLPSDIVTPPADAASASGSKTSDPARYLDPLELFSPASGHEVDTDSEDYEGFLPPWAADQLQLPPASIREPTTPPSNPNTATSLSSSNTGFGAGPSSAVRSISSSDSVALPAITSVTRGPSSARVVLTPTNLASDRSSASSPALGGSAAAGLGAAKQGKGKYKDLDDFLNEATESESEESSSEEEEEDAESVEEEDEESSEEEAAGSTGGGLSSTSSEDEDDSSDDEDGGARQRGSRPLLPEQNEWAM